MKFKRQTGMTLIELLIVFAITIMLISAIFWMPTFGKKSWQSSITRGSNRQDIHLISSGIQLELADSDTDTITNSTGAAPNAFSFLSAYNSAGQFITDANLGTPIWQKYVIYYIPSGATKLLRRDIYGTFTLPLTTSQLSSYCNGQGSFLSQSVSSMLLNVNPVNKSAVFSITVQDTNKNGKIDRQSLDTTILMRN